MAQTGEDTLVGHLLDGRYLIGQRIARGGMASVFMATDERLDREVAIKVMHEGLGDDQQFTDRFVREAKSAAKLNHRNVVSVFDQGKDGEIAYLVMEYVPGRTLRDLMREEAPMPAGRALALVDQVLVALSAAHAAKIIHRDVKPENVLITPDGDVKVADFGLARAVSAATTATGGTLIGTVSYLAPEIVLHDGADARSDVYAVGAMLFEMLTGTKPHAGESPIQVAYKHVHEDIAAPSTLQPDLPDYVDALVARATVRDRDQRSTDARVMLQQLRSVRRALDAGATSDPELTTDLLPRPTAGSHDTSGEATEVVDTTSVGRSQSSDGSTDQTSDISDDTVAVPVGAAAVAAGGVAAATADAGHGEPTMAWTNSPAQAQPVTSPASASTAQAPVADPRRAQGLHPPVSPESYREMRDAQKPRRRRGRRLLILAIIAAVLAALLGWYYAEGRYTDAPVLVGSTEKEAKADATRAGFTFKVDERRFSETVPAGLVISTDPDSGAKVLPESTILAVVSKGKDRVQLPKDIKGMTVDEFTGKLEAVDLVPGKATEKYDEKVDKGLLLGVTSIKADQQLKRGTTVDYVVSRGRKPIKISNLAGRPIEEGTSAADKAGFKYAVTEQFDDDVKKGIIISQSPNSGTGFKNDTITFVVSKGKDLVTVPSVVGKTRPEAAKILKDKGFKVRSFPSVGDYEVANQSPDGGKKAKRGATVNISFF